MTKKLAGLKFLSKFFSITYSKMFLTNVVNKYSLPGREVLYEPGKKDGQTKLVREGATVMVYNWSAEEGEWQKIGDVMGSAGGTQASSGKTLYEGVVCSFFTIFIFMFLCRNTFFLSYMFVFFVGI